MKTSAILLLIVIVFLGTRWFNHTQEEELTNRIKSQSDSIELYKMQLKFANEDIVRLLSPEKNLPSMLETTNKFLISHEQVNF